MPARPTRARSRAPRLWWRTVVAAALLAGTARADLEVAIPPGSPLAWSRSLPQIGPLPGTLTPPPPSARRPATDTVVRRGSEARPLATTELAVLAITTWDVPAHVAWVRRTAHLLDGNAFGGPRPGDGLYWLSMAPLLRLMLHRSSVLEPEVAVHLLELGETILPVLDAAETEPPLRDVARDLRRRIGTPGLFGDEPARPSEDRAELLERFVRSELARGHPSDPEGAFASRIFLFGHTLEPWLRSAVLADEPLVARNAAAALARCRTATAAEALLLAAAGARDDVVLARALAGLAAAGDEVAQLDWTPLTSRFEREEDPLRLVALADVLSGAGVDAIAPRMLAVAREGLVEQGELLGPALAALARLRHRETHAGTLELAVEAERRLRANPAAFRPERPAPTAQPDFPDPSDLRARLLLQRVLLLRLHVDPLGRGTAQRVLAMRTRGSGDEFAWRQREGFGNAPVRGLAPAVRLEAIAALAPLGDEGLAFVREVAADAGTDPALRAAAAQRLPWDERGATWSAWVRDPELDPGLRASALERLFAERRPEAALRARELVAAFAVQEVGGPSGADRALCLAALGALGERGLADVEELSALLPHVAGDAAPSTALDRLRVLVRALVGAAASRDEERAQRLLGEVMDYACEHRLEPRIVEEREHRSLWLSTAVRELTRTRGRAAPEPEVLESVAQALSESLVGHALSRREPKPVAFVAPVPLEEAAVVALGRAAATAGGEVRERAVDELAALLEDERSPHRPAIALALGHTRAPRAAPPLAELLLDPDPFVRLCAYEALRSLTGEDWFADWLRGPRADREAAAERYRAWSAAR